MEEQKEEKNLNQKITEDVEKIICQILDDGIRQDNIEPLYKLVDIHKDICNENYWKEKIMRYRGNYSNYSIYEDSYGRRGVAGTGRGRYRDGESSSYGRRGRYRGEDYLNDMNDSYQEYSYGRDNYGHDEDTMKSLKYMLDSVKQFMKTLEEDATSQEEVEMIKRTAKEISDR